MTKSDDLKTAREQMITKQITPFGLQDPHILEAFMHVQREAFVPEPYRALAYSEAAIPLTQQEHMLTPLEAARLIHALRPGRTDVLLEIGTGTGYLTALLSQLAFHVYTVEYKPERAAQAQHLLPAHHYAQITFLIGNGSLGWPSHAPYNGIVCTGAMPYVPNTLLQQLHPHGRLILAVGTPMLQKLMCYTCERPGHYHYHSLGPIQLPMLEALGHVWNHFTF